MSFGKNFPVILLDALPRANPSLPINLNSAFWTALLLYTDIIFFRMPTNYPIPEGKILFPELYIIASTF